jgi:hypothetical protein
MFGFAEHFKIASISRTYPWPHEVCTFSLVTGIYSLWHQEKRKDLLFG